MMETEQIKVKKITKKEILELGRTKQKISLIKLYRELTNAGLWDSKLKIEEAEYLKITPLGCHAYNLKRLWEIFKPLLSKTKNV